MNRVIKYLKDNPRLIVLTVIGCLVCALLFAENIKSDGISGTDGKNGEDVSDISVTDISYSFVNSRILPENEDTVYRFYNKIQDTDEKRRSYGAGNCEELRGEVIVAVFFVDDDVSKWSKSSVRRFTDTSVLPALEFIESEAEHWEIDLNISLWRFSSFYGENYDFKYDGTVNPDLNDGGSTKDLMEQAAKYMGYSNNMAFWWALTEKSGGKQVVPIFVLNKSGISYARNRVGCGYTDYCEQAVVFSEGMGGAVDRSSTFAHELLHLYGAEDLYIPDERYTLAYKLYPLDIMCLETRNMSKLIIDDFSAFALGWTDEAPAICQNEKWYKGVFGYDD